LVSIEYKYIKIETPLLSSTTSAGFMVWTGSGANALVSSSSYFACSFFCLAYSTYSNFLRSLRVNPLLASIFDN
jgi:hypothetical protein